MDKREFLKQQLDLLKSKRIDPSIEWQDIADFREKFNGESEHRDTVRKGSKLLNEYLDEGWELIPPSSSTTTNTDFSEKTEVQKERIKLQTEKLEMNKWLRELSRDELIAEHIKDAVLQLEPLKIPQRISPVHLNTSYLVAFGDCHYGIEYEIKGLYGDIINKYSPEIFEKRMWNLADQIIEKIIKEDIHELNIFELGDGLHGILKANSQLMKLRYGVIDSSIRYANFLSEWLNELSNYTRIKFQMVTDSNHNQLRLLGQPKNAFPDENMSKVILTIIKLRVKNNPNIVIIENPTGLNYALLSTYTVLGFHGETKNLKQTMNNFSNIYEVPVHYLVGAHSHHLSVQETGIDREVLSVRSIIGVDPYSMSIQKASNAGASMYVFELGKGKTCEYNFKLN
jgi:hypothetical protein